MKKVFLMFVMAGAFAVSARAQIKYGAKAGLNMANIGGSDVEGNKARAGFYAGGFVEIPAVDKLSVVPELIFSTQGTKSESDNDNKLNLNYLNIPVMARYAIASGFFAETGPQFGFLLSAKSKWDGNSNNVKDGYKKLDLSWGLGVGYVSTTNIGVNARFNFGLSKLDKDGDVKSFNRILQVGLFYVLGNRNQ